MSSKSLFINKSNQELTNLLFFFKPIQCHHANFCLRETKVYQESRELQEREALVSPVQR